MSSIEMNTPYKLKECTPSCSEEIAFSKEILVCAEIPIPPHKPNVDHVIQLKHEVFIESITKIPIRVHTEKIKYFNLLIRGTLSLYVEYSTELPEQTVHLVHTEIPFDSLIPSEMGDSFNEINLHQLSFHVKVDQIGLEKVNSRLLDNTTALFFWVKMNAPLDPCDSKLQDCDHLSQSKDFICHQIAINQTLCIPLEHHQIHKILDQHFDIEIKQAEVRVTPLLSLCCRKPIRKVVIKGAVEVLVKYISCDNQEVKAVDFDLPICTLLNWVDGPPPHSPICIDVVPEHFQIDCMDTHQLFCVLVLRLEIYRQHL